MKHWSKKAKHLSIKETAQFYDELIQRKQFRRLLGPERRYSINSPWQEKFLAKYYDSKIEEILKTSHKILDFGCGPGFLTKRLCGEHRSVTGVDISKEFIRLAKNQTELNLNVTFLHITDPNEFFKSHENNFDVIILFDVVHHLEDAHETLLGLHQLLKEGGKLLIFEPNLFNPAIFLLHLLDKNERGLLNLGTKKRYNELLELTGFSNTKTIYNGILIGPAYAITWLIVRFLDRIFVKSFFGFLNPKLMILSEKRSVFG